MKITHVTLLPLLLVFMAGSSISAGAWQSDPSCGNGNNGGTGGTGAKTPNKPPTPPEDPKDPIAPPSAVGEPVVPYTGNEFRRVDDLQIWGSVGCIPMRWSRHSNSRTVAGASLFGMAHYWRHSFQWEMAPAANDASGRAQVSLIYPDGAQFTFTEVTPGTWQVIGSITDQLLPTADGFVLLRQDASRYFFRKFPSGTSFYYLMNQIQDAGGNAYAVEYNASRQVTKITEPAGRNFQISYAVLSGDKLNAARLGTLAAAPAAGAWMEFPVTNSTAFRYLRVIQADRSYGNIAEIEVYEAGTNARLTGTVISADSAAVAQAALDGNPTTGFVSAAQTGGYVGFDFGTAKKIGRVRVLSVAGKESLQKPTAWGASPLKVEGGNQAPITTTAISKVVTSDGRSVDYVYTPFNDPTLPYVFPSLTSVVYGDGTSSTYGLTQVFPGSRPLVGEWDDVRSHGRQGRYKSTYQSQLTGNVLGAVASQINVVTGNPILTIGLQNNNLHTPKTTFANGGSLVQSYSILASGASITQEVDGMSVPSNYTFSPLGFIATKKDALNRVTAYTWAAQGKPLTKTHPDGSVEAYTYNNVGLLLTSTDQLGRVTSYTRDASNRIARIDHADGSCDTLSYNNLGQVASHGLRNGGTELYAYDSRGLRTQKTDALGRTTSYGYDSADRLSRVTDALGRTTTMVYSERGLITKMTNPDGTTHSYTYTKTGNVASETNELGNIWNYTYDVFQRVTSITDPLGRVTSTAYLPDSYEKKPLSITLPSGRVTTFTYDLAWHLLSTTVGAGTPEAATTTYTYDKAYNVVSISDGLKMVSKFTYDSLNRKIASTDPLGNSRKWSYDSAGNVLTETRPDGGVTVNVYDSLNRLVKTTDPKGQTTSMTYDAASNVTSMTDPRGSVYSWTYDLHNRRLSMRYPDGSTERYGYDAVGNPVTYTTRVGQVRTSVFDSRNREIQTNWSDSTPSTTRTFDAAGRVTSEANGVSQITTTYNAANQATSVTTTIAGQTARTISYAYDADGRLVSTTYPGGNVVATSYTARNQVAAIGLDGTTVAGYEHDAVGNVTAKHLENNTDELFTYDAAHRLTGIQHRKGFNLLASYTYTLDKVGKRTSKVAAVLNPLTETYAYDAVDQLTQAKYGTARTVAYTYDASGNRQVVAENGTAKSYTANALNEYISVGGNTLTYDANGNLTGDGNGSTYVYDAQNRLVQATVNGIVTTFAYDSRNRVVQRTANGITVNLTYNGWNLIEERDVAGALQQVYVHGAGTDEILTKITPTGAVYYLADGLGSTVALTDETGSVVESATYDAYGLATLRNSTGKILTGSGYQNRFLFTGREWLSDAGIYDYRNRAYSPTLGRFLQTDPIRFGAGDPNIYRYCGNNPTCYIDPTGKGGVEQLAAVAIILIIAAIALPSCIDQIKQAEKARNDAERRAQQQRQDLGLDEGSASTGGGSAGPGGVADSPSNVPLINPSNPDSDDSADDSDFASFLDEYYDSLESCQ